MKWKCAVGGAVLGLGWGIVTLTGAYTVAPSLPGPSELVIQLLILGALTTFGAAGGFVVGWLVDLILGRKSPSAGARPERDSE